MSIWSTLNWKMQYFQGKKVLVQNPFMPYLVICYVKHVCKIKENLLPMNVEGLAFKCFLWPNLFSLPALRKGSEIVGITK